jgi:DNA (cytosine-5)-methyltransferase 1
MAYDEQNQYIRKDGCVGTLTTDGSSPKHNNRIIELVKNKLIRIRKLTPKECWRLMGFDDKDIEKAQAVGMSNAQLYKQAGNSIVVNVLMAMFSQMI